MGFSFLTLNFKTKHADLTLNLYKDANTGQDLFLEKMEAGYIMIALQNENDAQVDYSHLHHVTLEKNYIIRHWRK